MAIADNSDKVWYYAKEDGQKYGPYTDEELIKLIRNGILSENDLDEQAVKETIDATGYTFLSLSSEEYKKKGLFGF